MATPTPRVGQLVKLVGEQTGMGDIFTIGQIVAVHERIDVWWDTPTGEDKVALMDALDVYGPEKAATAKWYAEIVALDRDSGTGMAVASFEVELIEEGIYCRVGRHASVYRGRGPDRLWHCECGEKFPDLEYLQWHIGQFSDSPQK